MHSVTARVVSAARNISITVCKGLIKGHVKLGWESVSKYISNFLYK